LYSTDLAFVHDAGFGALAARAGPALVGLLRRHGIRAGTIVELGCGSGITAACLAARGYAVVGIDDSAAMIRLARRRAPAARLRIASMATTRIPRCRAVVAVGEVVTYLPGGVRALRRLFRRVHAALEPGGVFIFDFIASAAQRTYPIKTTGGPGWDLVSRATFDRSRSVLTRDIIVVRRAGRVRRASRETHRVRVYRRGDVREALARAGFRVRMSRAYGRHRVLPGDVVVVARRDDDRPSARGGVEFRS
jgi:SAM-dependent methyltransferase